MTWIAFGSGMYILGLFSCAMLVWFLTRVTRDLKIDKTKWEMIRKDFQIEENNRELRHAARMAMQFYCGV